MIFAWVEERRTEFPVAVLCRVPGVSRSGYSARTTRSPSAAATRREELVEAIRGIHAEPRKDSYGSPRVTRDLHARGIVACENTVADVMRAATIRAKSTRRLVRATDSKHPWPVSASVLARDFTATGPNQKWVTDLTSIPTREGWLFLALVVDLFSRRVVGWAMDATMTSRLVVDALAMAVSRRGEPGGVIAHPDRGSRYASGHSQAEWRRRRVVGSVSGVGQCWDNAVIESTFGRMKVELVDGEQYTTRDEAKASIFEYIEVFYNRIRRHSTLEYKTPDEFERTHNPNSR